MRDTPVQGDRTKPAAMAMPRDTSHLEKGKYGPVFPRTPACYGFAVALFTAPGMNTVFENLEGFPADWKTNTEAFIKFVREHQCPSFLEYGEYPYVTADEIKKALRIKAHLSGMRDQMQ